MMRRHLAALQKSSIHDICQQVADDDPQESISSFAHRELPSIVALETETATE